MDKDLIVTKWLAQFNSSLATGNEERVASFFASDSYWRNVVGLEPGIRTVSGRQQIVRALSQAVKHSKASDFRSSSAYPPPTWGKFGGKRTLDAWLDFETAVSHCVGHVRLEVHENSGEAQIWTLTTVIDRLKGHDIQSERVKREGSVFERDWRGPNWSERRNITASFADRQPRVLIVGGGHAGLTLAAWLNAVNIENLVIDRNNRIGDNWRNRYNTLKLHSPTASVHFPFLSYPSIWPKYIPKDKIANWMEFYADALEINCWTEMEFVSAQFDSSDGQWVARLRDRGGQERSLKPTHVVMATSQIGTPRIPSIAGIENFAGQVLHSSQFDGGKNWVGKRVLVVGTGTSAHDIAQELHANKATVTMVQRGATEVIQIEPTAHMYLDALYEIEELSIDLKDLIACSAPIEVMAKEHLKLTRIARANDRELLDRLERVGFKVERDENSVGWPMKYFTRGGGYYFNVGCSDLIAAGEIDIIQYDRIRSFVADGVEVAGRGIIAADLIVLATGYKGFEDALPRWFGAQVAEKVGRVWGINPITKELNNMWTPTAMPGLWFAGGSFVHSRIYAKYIALQIKAREEGLYS